MNESKPSEQTCSFSTRLRQHPLLALRQEMEDLVRRFVGEGGDGWLTDRVPLEVDLSETNNEIDLSVDLPGVNPKEIDLRLAGGTLAISGKRELPSEEEGRTFHRIERRRGGFSRSITIPCPVDEDKVKAEYRDGVLIVTLAKTEESIGRKIKVKRIKSDLAEKV